MLDAGCGNNSPYYIKSKYPDIIYTGIDVGDYNQINPNSADKYIIVEPDKFAEAIASLPQRFDTVISSHNLEHCNDREKTLEALIKVLKNNGYLYLSFPSEKTVNFPGFRRGSLNYYDDPSHKYSPPDYNKTIAALQQNNMEIIFANKSYKPFFMYWIGFFLERKSKKDKEIKNGTWAYWGFETIIWAKKK
jgi:SAM-dependent methyltransferase